MDTKFRSISVSLCFKNYLSYLFLSRWCWRWWMRSRRSRASPEWCMIWPPNHPAPQSGNKTQHDIITQDTHSHTMHKHAQQIPERAGGLLSFAVLLPPSLPTFLPPSPPSCTPTPLFNIPTEGRPYCDGRICKGATTLLSPTTPPWFLIFFGVRDWLMLVIDNILFLIHVQQCISSLWWKGELLLPFLWGRPLKASGEKLWKFRKWTLMSCLRMHCGNSWTWKQVVLWRDRTAGREFGNLHLFSAFFVGCFSSYCCSSECSQPKTILSLCSISLPACILCYEDGRLPQTEQTTYVTNQ